MKHKLHRDKHVHDCDNDTNQEAVKRPQVEPSDTLTHETTVMIVLLHTYATIAAVDRVVGLVQLARIAEPPRCLFIGLVMLHQDAWVGAGSHKQGCPEPEYYSSRHDPECLIPLVDLGHDEPEVQT